MIINDIDFSNGVGDVVENELLYYTTSQVADMLYITDSKVRYYVNSFEDILNVQFSNKHRVYTAENIRRLKFLLKLRDSGMNIRQVREYCEDIDFDEETDLESLRVKDSRPMTFKSLSKSVLDVQEDHNEIMLEQQLLQLSSFKQEMLNAMQDLLEKNNQLIQEKEIETVSQMTDKIIEEFKCVNAVGIDNKLHDIQQSLANRREEELKKQKRGLFSRIKTFLFGDNV